MPLEPWDDKASSLDFDKKALEKCLFSLNIARHNVAAYPAEHPAVVGAIENFLGLLGEILEFQEVITLGCASNRLMVGGAVLDEKNAVYRSLAVAFFSAGISTISFSLRATSDEITIFLRYLRHLPQNHTSIHEALQEAGVAGIEISGFDFESLHTTDLDSIDTPDKSVQTQKSGLMWESFTEALLENTLDPGGGSPSDLALADPSMLADLMGHLSQQVFEENETSYEKTVIRFLRQADQEKIDSDSRKKFLDKLADFIDQLTPQTRRQFLGSAFSYLSCHGEMTEEVLGRLSHNTVIDILDDLGHEQIQIPPMVLELLGKLGESGSPSAPGKQVRAERQRTDAEVEQGVREIFQRPETERFVSGPYYKLLRGILGTRRLPGEPNESLSGLMETLENHTVENRLCEIILEVIDFDPHSSETAALEGNLQGLVDYFLQMGDFKALSETYQRLQKHYKDADPFAFPLAKEAMAAFSAPEFLIEVLEGFSLWDKDRHQDIRRLIRLVGEPFAEPLLDCLAEEPSISGRRLLMACIEDIGAEAINAIAARLQDERWFLTRNLVILLRHTNDPRVLKPLVHLIVHPHPKVQFEVMKTFVQFGDQRAERYLLRELGSKNLERRLNAVLLARSGAGQAVIEQLAGILCEGVTEKDLDLKLKTIQTLAELPQPEAGNALGALLRRKSLLHPLLHRRMKEEALQAIGRHRPPWGQYVLEQIAVQTGGIIGKQAGALLNEWREAGRED